MSVMKLQSRPFSNPAETLQKAMRAVDEETGIIRLVHEAAAAPDAPKLFGYGSLCGDLRYIGYTSKSPVGVSTSLDRDQAIAGAIGESIERYSAEFVPYEAVIVRPYSAIADQAISPWSLTLYDEDQYR